LGPTDANPTRVLLSLIAPDYPGFDAWLTKNLNDPKASKKVVAVGNAIAAFSMWQAKDDRNIKLKTFIVGPLFRGTGIGQHLLYHELRTWADNPKIERVHVTVASSKSDLIGYFRMFGFRVEGIAANRYPRTSAELVMAKHFLRETVLTPVQLQAVTNKLMQQFWGLVQGADSRFGVEAEDYAIPTIFPQLSLNLDNSESTVSPRIQLLDTAGRTLLTHDDESLMREFYPLRIFLKHKRYVLVPIYPAWVSAMLSTSGPHTPLKLRIDHAYYCYPKVSNLTKGDFVVFYETRTGGGRGAAIGSAIVQEVMIDTSPVLFGRYSDIGIYTLADVVGHENSRGHSMAIKFALFEPFVNPVSLRNIRQCIGHGTTVQGLTPIPRDAFQQILSRSF
jgi:ribosomal protein S18 acetylase RimI-like enzyme